MADKLMTSPPVCADEAAEIALGLRAAPEMITVEEYRARYGHEPGMYINVSAAVRDLADAIDRDILSKIYGIPK